MKKGILLKCKNKKCEYEWIYRGESLFYASCPRCKSSINIRKQLKGGKNE